MRVRYPLARRIAGFDFFNWLVMQKAHGAKHVVFDPRAPKTDKFTLEEIKARYESILKPGPALAGMTCSEGEDGEEGVSGSQPAMIGYCRRGGVLPRLSSVLPAKTERFTITLRNFRRFLNRNSREADWRAFAVEIGARVIQDYEVEPIHLHERMALYAGAEMNFFVTNGPVMLCFLSEYPAMGFDVQNSPPKGVAFGENYPFLLPQHKQVWEPDTLENIRRHWLEFRRSMG